MQEGLVVETGSVHNFLFTGLCSLSTVLVEHVVQQNAHRLLSETDGEGHRPEGQLLLLRRDAVD